MKNKKLNKQEYNIIDNYTFIEIPDKCYGYNILEERFAIKLNGGYSEIRFDNMTGYKLEVDKELQSYINKAKTLRKRLERKWKKEMMEALKGLPDFIKIHMGLGKKKKAVKKCKHTIN